MTNLNPSWPSAMSPAELADALARLDRAITSPRENAVLAAAADCLRRLQRELAEARDLANNLKGGMIDLTVERDEFCAYAERLEHELRRLHPIVCDEDADLIDAALAKNPAPDRQPDAASSARGENTPEGRSGSGATSAPSQFHILDRKRGEWRCAEGRGYSPDRADAGVYTREEADRAIANDLFPEDDIIAVPVTAAIQTGRESHEIGDVFAKVIRDQPPEVKARVERFGERNRETTLPIGDFVRMPRIPDRALMEAWIAELPTGPEGFQGFTLADMRALYGCLLTALAAAPEPGGKP